MQIRDSINRQAFTAWQTISSDWFTNEWCHTMKMYAELNKHPIKETAVNF